MALQLTKELLEIIPGHQRAAGNLRYYEEAIEKSSSEKRKGDDDSEDLANKVKNKIFLQTKK